MGALPPYPLTIIIGYCGEKALTSKTDWRHRIQDKQVLPPHHSSVALRRSAYGGQKLCEHTLTGKPTASAACGNNRLHRSGIRVLPSAGADLTGSTILHLNAEL